ncbi:MAG: hypothetical protein ACYTEL_09400 [Planctomycetota bacterium]|jgi:hypothetical protein
MKQAFDKRVLEVRARCSVNLLLEQIGRVLTIGGIITILAVLVERLLAVVVINDWTLRGFWGVAGVGILVLWALKRPSRMQASLLLDERLKLQERFSTALALAESADPFAQAARAQARQVAGLIRPQAYFPVSAPKSWVWGGAAWVIALSLLWYMPQKDLLGLFRRRQEQEDQIKQIETAQSDVEKTTSTVKTALQQLDDPDLAEDLAGLQQVAEGAKPAEIKRQAIRKLGELSDKIKQMQAGTQIEAMNVMQQMFKQLRGAANTFSQKLQLALAQGDFAKASNLLKQMQQELTEGKASDQQRKDLAEQLQALAKQLEVLAEKNEELEKELEKLGLDKKLAKLGEKALRQALQKQGLSQEKIEQMLKKAAACRMACGRCKGLGQAMGACGSGGGGLSADDLDALTEQLDELEGLEQQLMLTEAALAEIERACQGLGSGMCQGLGCRGPFSEGVTGGYGAGTGGPGRGFGLRGLDKSSQAGTKKTKVKSDAERGPAIASWYVKGTQVKGEARRDFSAVVQAARDSAAEAISDNQIPRKYEQAVKSYFGQLEESGSE